MRISCSENLMTSSLCIVVIVLVAADSVDEAVDLANASDYSLTAGLWTSNLYLAKDVSSRIHSGMCPTALSHRLSKVQLFMQDM